MFSFDLKGSREQGKAFIEALKIFSHLANVGDCRSLVIHPASTTHFRMDDAALAQAGITPGTIRLSIGLEDADDLIDDLKRALKAAEKARMKLTVNGREAYAYTGGKPFDPALPCVVFIHGALNDHSVWTLLARWFAHHGFGVLAVDLPGHMRSAGPALASVEAMADWTLALLDAAGVKQAALAGHSMGSLIALEAAGARARARDAARDARHRLPDGGARGAARTLDRGAAEGDRQRGRASRSRRSPPSPRTRARASGCAAPRAR